MALPNGDLITTVFDPQMAYPVDKRMQVDTLNSRDSMSMFIRWEGMEVYVLENSKKYILQGGRSNEYWKELGIGSGTGGTTFVGQFPTADLLPTSGRSAGDYAFVGTGDDFVQYNWDSIANQWVMAEGQTDMAAEFFHIGYKTPLRRPVIFPLFPKDVIVQESGDFVFAPETAVARFIFVGEVTAIRGIETAAADREIKLVNRTGSDILIRDKASGIPSGSGMDFGGTDYTWVNGSEITLKGNGTYWELAPNNQIAFSDHLDSVNAQVSVGSDGLKVISIVTDNDSGELIQYKEYDDLPPAVDNFMIINHKGVNYVRAFDTTESRVLSVSSVADLRGLSLTDLVRIRLGYYRKVETKGYYEEGDGGGIEYNIKLNSTSTDDCFLVIRPTNNLGVEFNPNIKDHLPAKISGLKSEPGFDNRPILLKIFASASGRSITFPPSLEFEYSGSMSITFTNGEIDFNGCTFRPTARGAEPTQFRFIGLQDVKIRNIKIDGRKDVFAENLNGMSIEDSSDVFIDEAYFENIYYHGLWVKSGTKNIRFGKTYYREVEGSETGSDIYISNTVNDDVSFDYIFSTRSELTPLGRQCMYIDGHNTDVNTLVCYNSRNPVDYRRGKHRIGSIIAHGGAYIFKVGGGNFLGDPEVEIGSVIGKNIQGETIIPSGAVVYNCKRFNLQSAIIEFDPTSTNKGSGITVRGTFGSVENVTIHNSYVKNFSLAALTFQDLSNTAKAFNIKGVGNAGADAVVRVENCTDLISARDYSGENVSRLNRIIGTNVLISSQSTIRYIERKTSKDVPNGNYSFETSDLDKYLRMNGTGNAVVIDGRFKADDVLQGEIESGSRTFLGGSGVTIRIMNGGANTLTERTYFKLIFKSAADALLVYDNQQIFPNASTTQRGIIEQATDAETITGTDTERAVHPAGLKALVDTITLNRLADTPASKTGNKNKTVKVSNDETTHVYVADGVDVRDITDGGSIAPTLTDGFIGSRLNFTSSTAVTLQGFTSAGGQSSLTLVNPHATNNLTLVHNGSGTVKYIDAGSADLVIAPKTAVKVEIVGSEIYRVL